MEVTAAVAEHLAVDSHQELRRQQRELEAQEARVQLHTEED